ncbi:MAG: hypothetical protein ACOX6T_12310, partial [Myxococcales bacterium]
RCDLRLNLAQARGLAAALLLAFVLPAFAPAPARAAADDPALQLQTVLPSLPGQNQVRWWEFNWRFTDFSPVPEAAPVRLFFYEEERHIAQLVLPFIEQAFRDFTEVFDFAPDQTVPFLLYNSHFEFESTTAFFISETVLGVTSTQDLTMALPYWGERLRFEHVMRHELAHQFTIQKVVAAGREAGACNPLQLLPLWFIEGIAEFISLDDLTPEVRAALADLLIREELPDLFSEGPGTFERIYLVGHAQARFIEETFGEGTVQRLLAESPRLCSSLTFFSAPEPTDAFARLLTEVTGASPDGLRRRWGEWARDQVKPLPEKPFEGLEGLEVFDELGAGQIDSFALAPDGRTLFYRTVDRDTGVAHLYLRDIEDPSSRRLVTQDQRLGLESLHPSGRRVTAVGKDRLAFIGRRGASDALVVRRYRREESNGRVRFDLLDERIFDLSDAYALIEGGYPAIDPTSGAVVFSGLSRETGFLDIFRVGDPFDRGARIERVTSDPFAEIGLVFAPDGALFFASDATPDARFEIARLSGDAPVLLTRFESGVDATSPFPLGDEGFLFDSGESGRLQAYRASEGEIVRVSALPTSLQSPALDHQERLLGLALIDGQTALVRLPRAQPVSSPIEAIAAEQPEPWRVPQASLGDVQRYRPLATLGLEAATLLVSGGPLILGNLVFADMFRSELIGLSVYILGDIDLTEAEVFYFDRSGRFGRGISLFLDTGLQLVEQPRLIDPLLDSYFVQRFGARAFAEYPFGRFTRVEAFVAPQGIRAFDFAFPESPFALANSGVFPALEIGARFVIDTTRVALAGPYAGYAASVGATGTYVFGGPDPFATLTGELRASQPLLRGYERLFLHERVIAGANVGGDLAEQYYLPAAYNLRAFREGSSRLIGSGYYLGQLELHFPLAPVLAETIYLQGLVGVDAGSIFFDWSDALDQRVADAVLGASFGFGPLILRLQWARPFSIGAGVPVRGWIFHLALLTPFGALF